MAKILIVEDDNHLREIYELRMQAAGHDVVSAADGEEALKVAIKEKPDLVISDVMMPKISGFDMLDILRSTEETKNAKIIMMTALSQAEDKQRAENLGADRYLVKSQVTLDDVAQVTEEVLSGTSPASSVPSKPAAETQDTSSSETHQPQPQSVPEQVQVAAPTAPAPAPQPQQSDDTSATTPDPQVQPPADPAVVPGVQPQADDQTMQTPAAPTTDTTQSVDPSSIDSEESAIAKQIENFMHTNDDNTAQPSTEATNQAAPQPQNDNTTTVTSTPDPQVQPPADPAVVPGVQPQADDQTMQTPAAPAADTTQNDPQNPASPSLASAEAPSKKKKVIQPLNDLNASKSEELENLLKKEEVKEEMSKIVSDITTKDIADLSDDSSAEKALREAQTEFSSNSPGTQAQETTTPGGDQDIQITQDGKIVPQDPEEVAAAEALKAAQQANSIPTTEQQSTEQVTSPPTTETAPEPQSQVAPQPNPEPQSQPETEPNPQSEPVIPHTNGTAIDGVIPATNPSEQTQETPPLPTFTNQSQQATQPIVETSKPPVSTPTPSPLNNTTPPTEQSPQQQNPNDIAL